MKMTSNHNQSRFITLQKRVGETPLECLEAWREEHPELADVPLAYAGRLDPMASGTLLILIGDECKRQASYHGLDKAYAFSVLLGVHSDSGDVLGIVNETGPSQPTKEAIARVLEELTGTITLPFPIFSARTVQGKPLHTWTMEGRLSEIEIPKQTSKVYSLTLEALRQQTRTEVYTHAKRMIDSLPTVTDPRKSLGNDFRRPDVKASWERFWESGSKDNVFCILDLVCIASSGTYMRSLAEVIGEKLGTTGLACGIHRTIIGRYERSSQSWSERFE
jgi:tRNA pseudouridine(55) synthase